MNELHSSTIGYVYIRKKADRFFNFYLPDFIDIQLYESSTLLAKGKQPFYIYGFELLKTALQTAKNLGNTEVFTGYIFFVSI